MITHATGQPIRPRLSPSELREHELQPGDAQGPVPACLVKGYEPPAKVVILPNPEPPPVPRPNPRPGRPKLPPAPDPKPLLDVDVRRALIEAELAGGAWLSAWEIARATGLHPEVVRTILRCSCASSRPIQEAEIKARGALIEYAAAGTPGAPVTEPRRRPTSRWTRALCEVCEKPVSFREVPFEGGADIVCTVCGSLIAAMYYNSPGRSGHVHNSVLAES